VGCGLGLPDYGLQKSGASLAIRSVRSPPMKGASALAWPLPDRSARVESRIEVTGDSA
jgi:hypothetical protein